MGELWALLSRLLIWQVLKYVATFSQFCLTECSHFTEIKPVRKPEKSFGCQCTDSRLSTYWRKTWSNKLRCCHHTSVDQTPIPCVPAASPGLKPNIESVKSRRSGDHKPDTFGLSCKATKCSDAGAGDLGMLTTHETSPSGLEKVDEW